VTNVDTGTKTPTSLRALVSAMRPRQWVKNVLVVVAPVAAGADHSHDARNTAITFAAFCLTSSGIYLLNDVRDIESDRQHPTKQARALASGQFSVGAALVAAGLLLAGAFTLAALLVRPFGLLGVLGIYVAISLAYSLGVKNLPVIEMAAVASGFFLRAYAGAVASHIYASQWFLVVISFGALFLVIGKRFAEKKHLGSGAESYRPVLSGYTTEFLRSALVLTASVVVTGYCLWAFDTTATGLSSVHHLITPIRLSVVPVVLAMLHVLRLLDAGEGAAPEDLVFTDHTVQALGVVWATLVVIGVYG